MNISTNAFKPAVSGKESNITGDSKVSGTSLQYNEVRFHILCKWDELIDGLPGGSTLSMMFLRSRSDTCSDALGPSHIHTS